MLPTNIKFREVMAFDDFINEEKTAKLFQVLQDAIFAIQQNQAKMLGQSLYRPSTQDGFKQSDVYEIAGKNDNVANLLFRKNYANICRIA